MTNGKLKPHIADLGPSVRAISDCEKEIADLTRRLDTLVEALEKIQKESIPFLQSSVAPNYDVCQFGRIEEIASQALAAEREKRKEK